MAPPTLLTGEPPPVALITRWLKRRMAEYGGRPPASLADRVLVVRAKTGSGKSTVLPVYIFRVLRSERTAPKVPYRGRNVLCTQPKVLTAQTIARGLDESPHYPDMVLEKTLGYQTGPRSEAPVRGLVYATAGVLLAQLRSMTDQELIDRYAFIIIDEAHERTLDLDTILMLLKRLLLRNLGNARLPFVLLASATIELEPYLRYFDLPPDNAFDIEGRPVPVTTRWPPHGYNDYPAAAAETALRIHREHPDDPPHSCDILIFLPGNKEIESTAAALLKEAGNHPEERPFLVLQIDRKTINADGEDYRLALAPSASLQRRPGAGAVPRRIIISTSVAETGLTVPTLGYVIDAGWARSQERYFPENLGGLITRPAARSRLAQRRGRAGRLHPGEYHPLFTENVYHELEEQQLPEIVTEGVEPILLDLVRAQKDAESEETGEFRVEKIDLLEAPPPDALAAALETALALGMVGPQEPLGGADGKGADGKRGFGLTAMGRVAARMSRVSMHETRLVCSAFLWGVATADLISVAAVARDLGERGLRGLYSDRDAIRLGVPSYLQEYDSRDLEALISDDLLAAMLVFEGWRALVARRAEDLLPTIVNRKRLLSLAETRDTLVDDLAAAGVDPFWNWDRRLITSRPTDFYDILGRLKYCIYGAYQQNLLLAEEPPRDLKPTEVIEAEETGGIKTRYRHHLRPGLTIERVGATRGAQVVTPALTLQRRSARSLVWQVTAPLISVLDGHVLPDLNLLRPRGGDCPSTPKRGGAATPACLNAPRLPDRGHPVLLCGCACGGHGHPSHYVTEPCPGVRYSEAVCVGPPPADLEQHLQPTARVHQV